MTAQVTEMLRYRGELLRMFATPLETLPPERRRNFIPSGNTANWRGYIALWEIRDDHLYLADIKGSICVAAPDPTATEKKCGGRHQGPCEAREAKPSDFTGGNEEPDGAVLADWFSGDLRIPRGNLLQYVHMGFESQYERYLTLAIVQGRLLGEATVANPYRPPGPLPGRDWFSRMIARWR